MPRVLLLISGWMFTLAVTLFMLADVSGDLRMLPAAVDANAGLGMPANTVFAIGAVGLACTLLYAFPPTAFFGAVLLTGFLGGAVATHVRVHGGAHDIGENVLIGLLAWAGLWLRDARLRRLLPIHREG